MIELSQLEQLIAFADQGTLSKAAEQLHMSQPSLTRAMQKLESEFRVTLFDHKKNKLTLNENGLLALEYARGVLAQSADMLERVRAFDRSRHTVSVGSCAPAPLWEISPRLSSLYPQMTISTEIKDTDILLAGLEEKTYQIVILPEKLEADGYECVFWGTEQLFLSLPVSHPLAESKGVFLKEMDGENMLLYSEIGFWHNLHRQKMPHSRFLLQNERFAFNELVNSSILPSFTSDIAIQHPEYHPPVIGRSIVPILDKEAKATYYCYCRKKDLTLLNAFIYELKRRKAL